MLNLLATIIVLFVALCALYLDISIIKKKYKNKNIRLTGYELVAKWFTRRKKYLPFAGLAIVFLYFCLLYSDIILDMLNRPND